MTAAPTQRHGLSVVVVTHRAADAALACLASLRDGGLDGVPDAEVIVVDSGSGDGTAERITAARPDLTVIALADNVGFARGINRGLQAARGALVLLLNPDTVVPPGAIAALVAHLDAHPDAAAVGPRLIGADGAEQIGTQPFPSTDTELSRQWEWLARALGRFHLDPPQPTAACEVDWVSGASLLLRAAALDAIGGLDEGYFLYFEETDWCRRARAAGWTIRYAPEVTIVHVGGVSARASGTRVRSGRAAAAFVASRWRYFRTNHGLLAAVWVAWIHRTRRAAERLHLVGGAR